MTGKRLILPALFALILICFSLPCSGQGLDSITGFQPVTGTEVESKKITSPVGTVKEFINALNDRDYNAAIECLNPKISKAFRAASNILFHFIGVNITDILDLFPALYEITKPYVGDIRINIKEVVSEETEEDSAVVVVNVEIFEVDESGNAKTEQCTLTFNLQRFDEGWRITGIED